MTVAIIAGCLLFFLIYHKTTKYDTKAGAAMGLLFIMLLAARILLVPGSMLFEPAFFWFAGLLMIFLTVIPAWMITITKKKLNHLGKNYALTLFVLYLPFALVQQLLFQFIFFETFFSITDKLTLSILFSALYFTIFHIKWAKKRVFSCFLVGILWTTYYYYFQNLFWIVLSHAFSAVIYYQWFIDKDNIAGRLNHGEKLEQFFARFF